MLLGSFVEEMDAINDSAEDLSSPDEVPTSQVNGTTPTKSFPLRSISEEWQDGMPLSAASMGSNYGMLKTPSPENYTLGRVQNDLLPAGHTSSSQRSAAIPRHINSMPQSQAPPAPPEQSRGKRNRLSGFFSLQS
jgi:hypothetical protein